MTVDFQTRYNLDLKRWLRGRTWNDLWTLVAPLIVDQHTHTVASVLGWTRPPHPVEESLVRWLEAYAAAHRGRNKVNPGRMPRPWETPPAESKPKRSPQAKKEARTKLAERFGFTP